MPARLSVEDTLLKRLAQNFQDVAAALGAFIQTQDAMMSPRHLARHGDVPAGTQTHIRDGVMWGVTQCRRLSRLIPSQRGGTGARQDHDNISSSASTSPLTYCGEALGEPSVDLRQELTRRGIPAPSYEVTYHCRLYL
jgi:hypothetical protein